MGFCIDVWPPPAPPLPKFKVRRLTRKTWTVVTDIKDYGEFQFASRHDSIRPGFYRRYHEALNRCHELSTMTWEQLCQADMFFDSIVQSDVMVCRQKHYEEWKKENPGYDLTW